MKIYLVSIFPEIFNSFLSSSILHKAQQKGLLEFVTVNPREFCPDKHRQIDDEIYGGGSGMLIKAKPMIDAVESVINDIQGSFKIIFLSPSKDFFDQKKAFEYSKVDNIVFVCGRYEGIDFRFEKHCRNKYPQDFVKTSLGKYVLMGGEVASMVMIESITRLIPGIIGEPLSYEIESYCLEKDMLNIEFPQFTRPEDVYGHKVPDTLLSGNHAHIDKRRNENEISLD